VGGEVSPGWLSIEDLLKEQVETEYPKGYLKQYKPDPNDICLHLLSGGTTGLPKAIPRTYNDYICGSDYVGKALGFTDDSVALIMTPAGHGMALVCIIAPTLIRGSTIVLSKSTRVKDLLEVIHRNKVTHLMPMPIQLAYFKEAQDTIKDYDLTSLKVIAVGAARPDLVRWAMEDFGVNLINLFGMSEGPQIFGRWDSPRESQMYSIGRSIIVHPDNMTRLVDDNDKEVERGKVGELVSKGPATFKGYFRNEEENRRAFDEQGCFHTGDLMSIREDGRFVFEGRKKYMIKRGGENIYPEVVEALVTSHPKVAVCAMIGMPDPGLNERLCAFVQPTKGEEITLDQIVTYLKEKGLAIFQCPERLEIVSGWPLSSSNKINNRLLKAYITTKLYQEGVIDKEYGNYYLRLEKIEIDDVLSGRVQIEFTGALS
jgi:non-ribosomal peptide synthetase component E (peptide arylation enzyme)